MRYTGLNRDFQSGPLGLWYLPATAAAPSLGSLLDGGSRTVAAAGLTHYTVATAQGKDAGTVAVGYHYPALDPAQLAIGVLAASDVDGDGLPDYQEDVNGNGIIDSGESFFTNADSDADGLSDGCERAVGTNPTNAISDGTVPDAQRTDLPRAVYMSMAHALRVEAASGDSLNKVRVDSYAMVPQGTDAVWVEVSIYTDHTPTSEYSIYNDQLTYKLKIPGVIERSGSFRISELGQGVAKIMVDTGWTQCHAQCLSSAPYAEFHLTAQNVKWAGSSSKVIVRLGAMKVEMVAPDPAVNHRLMFTPAPTGTLDLHMGAVVVPDEARGWVDSHGGLRFAITDIEGSTKSWMFGGSNGEAVYGSDTGRYDSEVRFTGLPPQNSALGPKTVTLSADGLWGVDQQIQVRVFYPADAANHPDDGTLGANRGTYCGSNEAKSPNWYYYWNQPEAGASFGSPRFCANGWCWGLSHTVCESAPNPPWVAHVHYDARLRETVPGMPSSWPLDWRQKRKGIDYFALIARHEGKHVQLWTAWGATHPNRDNPSVPSDGDIDGLPDSLETPPEYAPADVDGNDDGVPDGHEYIFRNQEWPKRHDYDGNDWSNIGCTYNGQHYTTD